MQSFVEYVRTEMLSRFQAAAPGSAAMVPLRKPTSVAKSTVAAKNGNKRAD
jgi:hypothetical protein